MSDRPTIELYFLLLYYLYAIIIDEIKIYPYIIYLQLTSLHDNQMLQEKERERSFCWEAVAKPEKGNMTSEKKLFTFISFLWQYGNQD